MTLTEFLLARIAEDEAKARALLRDLEAQIKEERYTADERGPFTPARMLSAQLWAHYDGQTQRRSFARGQQIATLASPARVLAECEAKRQVVDAAVEVARVDLNEPVDPDEGLRDSGVKILCALALPYADHPNYQPEWSP